MNAPVTGLKPEAEVTGREPRNVYQAIAAVMADVAKEGIAKDRNNAQQGYKFRGIDDVYNALAPILSRHGLLMLPRVLTRELVERQSRNGSPLFYVTVDVEFTLVSADDGSTHVIKTYGEAQDSADKATNKAMSAAYKYAAMQAFCIPTEGDNDPDATTHEVASAADAAINVLRTFSDTKDQFTETWNKNKDGWKAVMSEADYRRVVAVMREIAAKFAPPPSPPPPPPPRHQSKPASQPQADNGFGELNDEIPF